MPSFMAYFLLCNFFLTVLIGMLLMMKHLWKRHLSGSLQYAFRIPLFLLLCMPFLSFRPAGVPQFLPLFLFRMLHTAKSLPADAISADASLMKTAFSIQNADWMNDFAISVNRQAPSAFWDLLLFFWCGGMFVMLLFMIKSRIHLHLLEHTGLPLQNPAIRKLYEECLLEMKIRRKIPVYSSAFFRSPVFTGFLRPKIYLPIDLVLDENISAIRYMILHELQHYKHYDSLSNYIACAARIIYWFHPVVWLALKEMRTDREIACDSSVLRILSPDEYLDYGNTLIHFAGKTSAPVSLFATGMSGSLKQLRKRIENIAVYRPQTKWQVCRGIMVFTVLAVILLESAAVIPVYAANDYSDLPKGDNVFAEDLSAFFQEYDGCFVLYDSRENLWNIYNEEMAAKRTSPDSTYKIYSALLGLENKQITPDSNFMEWDGHPRPMEAWNRDQTLSTALRDSVNWYFQSLDKAADMEKLTAFYEKLDYGNHDLSSGISDFWLESSLKISAVEQVELLQKFYANEFSFAAENVQAVKDALTLSSSGEATLYGKTGTGNINGANTNGWFIGYVETADNVYFFASNIQNGADAGGRTASAITMHILHDKGIY